MPIRRASRPNSKASGPYQLVTRFGGGEPRSYVGCFCGYSHGNSGQAAFFALDAADPTEFLDASDEALFAAVDAPPKIIRGVSTNKAPAGAPQAQGAPCGTSAPCDHHRRGGGVSPSGGRAAMAARFVEDPDAPPKPVERQIYGEFYFNADKQLLQEFQRASWPRRQEIVASLSDPRLCQLGRRLVAFHSPELLSAEEMALFNGYLREKWCAPDAPETEWMTFAKAQGALIAHMPE